MRQYPHMCRDEHQEIGHSDSEHERCPLCRANDRIAELEQIRTGVVVVMPVDVRHAEAMHLIAEAYIKQHRK